MANSHDSNEPVAWVGPSWLHPETRTWVSESFAPEPIDGWIPLYTAPHQWQGLTEDEILRVCVPLGFAQLSPIEVARAIEAELKRKNT